MFLEAAIDYYGDRLSQDPLELYLEEEKEIHTKETKFQREESLTREDRAALKSNLRFPSKIICIANQPCLPYDSNLMMVSDTGNNRVLVINLDTHECLDSIGSGNIGLVDGDYSECSFHHPQGLCHVYRENEHFVYV